MNDGWNVWPWAILSRLHSLVAVSMDPAPLAVVSALTAWVLKDWARPSAPSAPTTCSCLCQVPEVPAPTGWSGWTLAFIGASCCLVGLAVGLVLATSLRLGWSEANTPASLPGKGKKGLGVFGKTLELKY